MKTQFLSISLLALVFGCGGSPVPAASPSAAPADPAMAHEAHRMDHPMPAAEPVQTVEGPETTHAEPPAAAAAASSNAMGAASSASTSAQAPAAAGAKGTLTVTVSSTPASAAKQAVAYLEDAPKDRDVTGAMDNRQMAFIPHILVVTAGAKVTFTNSDPFPHNVFSPDNEKWDMGVIPSKGARVRRFDKPGFYTVLCNMHPNMKAYIAVVPSSYFAKADKNGEFTIKDIPAGKHELVVWAPGVKPEHKEVVVDGDRSLAVELHR